MLAQPRRPLEGFLVIVTSLFVFTQLQPHFLGCWLAAGLAVFLLKTRWSKILAVSGMAFASAGMILVQLGTENKMFASVHPAPAAASETLVVLGITLMLPFLALPYTNRALSRVQRFATAISAISFSLYLFHYPLNMTLDAVFPKATTLNSEAWLNFSLRALICFVGSIVCYAAFERNTDALRRRLRHFIWP